MLTSVYYYGHYRPYILKNYNRSKIADVKTIKRQAVAESSSKDKFVLNNTLKKEVIQYAANLSGSVNLLRESTRDIMWDIYNFKNTEMEDGLGQAKEDLANNLEQFVDAYNRNKTFVTENSDSKALSYFVDDLVYDVSISTTALSKYRINVLDNGKMVFDREAFNDLKGNEVLEANQQNYAFFKNMYDSTGELLTMPLSEHMKFKNLGYYYNYKLGTIEKDSFKLIQSGMLIDKVV